MEKSINKRIANYQFEDAKRGVRSVVFGNGILWLVIFMYDAPSVVANPYASASLLSVILVLILMYTQDWKSSEKNLLAIGLYLLLCILELSFFGIPQSPLGINSELKKGVMLEMLVLMAPYIYTGMRFILVIPLIQVYRKSRKWRRIQ